MDLKGTLIRLFSGYTTDVWSFSYNKATQRLAAGSYAKNIRVWDFLTSKPVLLLEGNERSSLPVCISPAGDVIASGSLDKTVRLWNASTGAQKSKMELHTENIFAIDFHPSGKYLVSASVDKTLRLWNANDGKIIRTFTGHTGAIFDVQFTRDGNHLISCDAQNCIILWETATGRKVQVFTEHTGAVNALRLNSDGSAFASVSDDRTVRYWPLDKKVFLAGSYFEKEIAAKVTASPLFAPRGNDESKPDFTAREAEANKFLDTLYEQYYEEYIEILKNIPVDGMEKK
jgi:WD40 repeat protein